jgi:nucleotide-binding universal stress UspA family protein
MPQIVVASRLGPDHERVTTRAATVAQSMGADIRMLHVLPELLPGLVARPRKVDAQQRLMDCTGALMRRTGRRVSYKVAAGDVAGRILRESDDREAVLTVIGHETTPQSRLGRAGSASLRCLQRTRNAVLVVRNGEETAGQDYRRVLIAHDDAITEDRLTPYLPHLAPNAELHSFAIPAGRKAGEHVTGMRRALGADLLVIGMPRDEGLNPFRFRRLPPALVRMPECDTLFVPHETITAPPRAETRMEIRIAS